LQSDPSVRILVIEDHDAMRAAVVGTLSDYYACEEAPDGATARRKLAETEFELAVCEISLPDESGWDLASEVITQHEHTSVVFLTGEDDLEFAKRGFELGAHGYVVKPYSTGQFLITVMNALKRRELEIAQESYERAIREQLQAVIDHAPLRIYVKDRDLRLLAINRIAAAAAAGARPDELIGRRADDFMSPDAVETSQVGDRAVFDTGEAYESEEEIAMGGETRTLMTSKFPLLDAEGKVYAVCGISADITASKQAERLREELLGAQQAAILQLRSSRQETVERLSRAIEVRDSETGGHVQRMARISRQVAVGIGLTDEEADLIRAAAPMHDVGKIGISDEILRQPGALSEDERTEMEKHTIIGHALLAGSDSELLRLAASIALNHHERWDGTGYPSGLGGEEIPLSGRIVAVADVFDALLSDRPYRPAMELDQAFAIMRDGRGSHFDPQVVDYLLGHLDDALELRETAVEAR
jgi:PAS domain S-box-containing protein